MRILLFAFLIKDVLAFLFLEKLSSMKLPATVSPSETYKLFAGTAEEAAYDPTNQILYVVGETSRLLHVVDISNQMKPVRLFSHQFSTSDGIPHDVAVCGTEVAVAVSSPIKDVYEGHVYFFHTATKSDKDLVSDGRITVGSSPDMLTFTSSCDTLLVANEGKAMRDANNQFQDPPGTISVIRRQSSGTPSEQFVYFDKFENRIDIRAPSRHVENWPITGQHRKFSEDAEPEHIAVTPDGRTAYITMQRNDAVATMSLSSPSISQITPLPHKDWSKLSIDASDLDGGIHMRNYKLKSIRQPDNAKVITIGRKNFLVTADEGQTTSYTSSIHGFNWVDYTTGTSITPLVDTLSIDNVTFMADLKVNSKIGHLVCSKIDGLNLFTRKLDEVNHFGGRGFSIWDTSDFSLVYDSGDEIEREVFAGMPNIFNTDCPSRYINTMSPDNLKDSQSDNYGPKIGTLDVITDNVNTYIVVGSETVGTIFLYSVDLSSGKPVPKYETAYRNGDSNYVWSELYTMDIAGDVGISAVGFIPSNQNSRNATLIYVVGADSGSFSLYQINRM